MPVVIALYNFARFRTEEILKEVPDYPRDVGWGITRMKNIVYTHGLPDSQ